MQINMNAKAAYLKDRVSMRRVIALYHHTGKRDGRTSCPFHGGVNDNLGYDDRVFHCFVCGAKGDVITFTERIHNIGFSGALSLLDRDFSVGLQLMSDAEATAMQAAQREAERQRKETAKAVAMTVQRMYGRIQYWALHRPVQTEMHTRCVESLDRVVDDLVSGKGWSGDPKAFARSWINCVRAAEKEAAHAG